jgi:hypothetical protein
VTPFKLDTEMRDNKQRYKLGNYQKEIMKAIFHGVISQTPGAVTIFDVKHDSWCNFFKGGICNCQPDIITQYRGKGKD